MQDELGDIRKQVTDHTQKVAAIATYRALLRAEVYAKQQSLERALDRFREAKRLVTLVEQNQAKQVAILQRIDSPQQPMEERIDAACRSMATAAEALAALGEEEGI